MKKSLTSFSDCLKQTLDMIRLCNKSHRYVGHPTSPAKTAYRVNDNELRIKRHMFLQYIFSSSHLTVTRNRVILQNLLLGKARNTNTRGATTASNRLFKITQLTPKLLYIPKFY